MHDVAPPTPPAGVPAGAAPLAAAAAETPEQKKRRRLVGIMAFNFTFFLLMVLYQFGLLATIYRSRMTVEGSPLIWIGIFLIAGVAGAVGYSVGKK